MDDKKLKWPPKTKHHGSRYDIPPGNTPVIESPNAIVTRAHGPQAQVVQTNTLSTPVLLMALGLFAIFGVGIGYAVVKADAADDKAVIAEREARLAQRRYDDMRILLEVNGIKAGE